MSKLIIIGNIISLLAAVFTIAAAVSKNRRSIYGFQTLECLTMTIASVFFQSFSGVTTFLLNTIRNLLLAYDRFTKRLCILFLFLLTALGLLFNNRGALGIIPIVATFLYTLGTYFFRKELYIKLNSFVNLVFWAIYNLCVLDFVSAIMDSSAALCTICAVLYIYVLKPRKANDTFS